MPEGLTIRGVMLDADTVMGNMNFYKSIEGFMESFPQAMYQTSIMIRTPLNAISKIYYRIEIIKPLSVFLYFLFGSLIYMRSYTF